ncbi:hypothetical protein NOR_07390 [Metarhizium rileyi]|uniref:FAD-binding domain-containing protein n=1 Tax=Metarhizium rileyi (strain RCEF 4871) TaxID=1649241 RepID=A0A166YG58_METRR|nr:hypothetical protein NOR_07390 [Metarhizium rileyi RCEF 4871]
MGDPVHATPKPQIAIVGGGIVSMILALGLTRQNIPVRVYERAAGFREIGAGIAFSACARRCMELVDPAITAALKRCGAVPVSDENDDNDYLRWIDGYNQHRPDDPSYQRPLAQIGGAGFCGCRRDQFLEELAKDLPPGVIEFRKRMESLELGKEGKVVLAFADGTMAEADAVIGCDGIKSSVRKSILGAHHPASNAQYTNNVAYRGLIPMEPAIGALGHWKANNFHHHVGPGAHVTHYPVANHQAINVAVFLSDEKPWSGDGTMVAEGSRDEVEAALHGWHPTVLNLIKLLPEKLTTWGLFDMWEYPAPKYNKGCVCLAGDAAHAASPHHGAGACLGVEDALCLTTLLGQVCKAPTTSARDLTTALEVAFEAFDAVRRRRTQWLVNSSRRVCDLYHQSEWADPNRWTKADTCFEEIRDRSYKIWHFDADEMVEQTLREYKSRLELQRNHDQVQDLRIKDSYVL